MGNRTPLYQTHADGGAKIVDFAGWDMPIQYTSQIEEHHQVRQDAGMFDVSHMVVVDLTGERVRELLQKILANNVDKLRTAGKALYTTMLKPDGGVIDDLIVYFQTDTWFRLVVNAATREKDLAWIQQHAINYNVHVAEQIDLAMIAVQGPNARAKALTVIDEPHRAVITELKPFNGYACESGAQNGWFIARTGYTGEDGFEVMLPSNQAATFWQQLEHAGVAPCGLGARDTLRLEAGMNLYGSDMDETTSPLISGLGWTIAWDPEERDFIGRAALEAERTQGVAQKLVGLVLEGRGVLRNHQKVITAAGEGEITSGSFSPTMGKAIALARIPAAAVEPCEVEIRGKLLAAKIVKPPFVRNGNVLVEEV